MSERRLSIGDEVTLCVRATVSRVSDSHGLCYEVELGRHDFDRERRVWVNPDELAGERRAADLTPEEAGLLSWLRDLVKYEGCDPGLKRDALAILDRLTTNGGKP
jgi:hypothetical protein